MSFASAQGRLKHVAGLGTADLQAKRIELQIIDETEKEIASAIEGLIDIYPAHSHAAIYHAARVALGNASERWKQ